MRHLAAFCLLLNLSRERQGVCNGVFAGVWPLGWMPFVACSIIFVCFFSREVKGKVTVNGRV